MFSCNHYSDQCQPILYRFPICYSIKPSAAFKGKKRIWACDGTDDEFDSADKINVPSLILWQKLLRKFHVYHIQVFIHLLICLQMESESWSCLISFMLPPMWTVNTFYITASELSTILLGFSLHARPIFCSLSFKVMNFYIFLDSGWIPVKQASVSCNKRSTHWSFCLSKAPNPRMNTQKKRKAHQCWNILSIQTVHVHSAGCAHH